MNHVDPYSGKGCSREKVRQEQEQRTEVGVGLTCGASLLAFISTLLISIFNLKTYTGLTSSSV